MYKILIELFRRSAVFQKRYCVAVGRRTKIICTIGPASEAPETLEAMIQAGMNVARIGMAHNSIEKGIELVRRVRAASAATNMPVGILVDLPGPKIRVGAFDEKGVELIKGSSLKLTSGNDASNQQIVNVDYPSLAEDVRAGDVLTFGDGGVTITVTGRDGDFALAKVTSGGVLRGRPGLHIPGERLRLTSPTDEDIEMADAFVKEGVDMLALSFVRSGSDIRRLALEPHPRGPLVVAKIELRAAIENLEGIIAESGAIMVARGDLGTECSLAELPHLQKDIIRRCIAAGRPVITATQMLESMVTAPSPTRAEASDVANAVIDGTSAVMLSGETAVGVDPVRVVRTMAEITSRADENFDLEMWTRRLDRLVLTGDDFPGQQVTNAMTSAAARTDRQLKLAAILCISGSGYTVRSMARYRPRAPIIGCTTDENTLRQLNVSWGTRPLETSETGRYEDRVNEAILLARRKGYVKHGDTVGILAGIDPGTGSTDVFRLMTVK